MTPHAILRRAAAEFRVTVAELTGPSRARHLVCARFAAAWAIHRLCPTVSLAEIGRLLGGRDHTTIVNALSRAETLAREDAHYCAQLHALLDEEALLSEEALLARPAITVSMGERWWLNRAYWWPHTTPAA